MKFTSEDFAELCCAKVEHIEKWRKEGKITPIFILGKTFYAEHEVDRFMGLDEDGNCIPNSNYDQNGVAIGELAQAQRETLITLVAEN
jgi:hypothetical protein